MGNPRQRVAAFQPSSGGGARPSRAFRARIADFPVAQSERPPMPPAARGPTVEVWSEPDGIGDPPSRGAAPHPRGRRRAGLRDVCHGRLLKGVVVTKFRMVTTAAVAALAFAVVAASALAVTPAAGKACTKAGATAKVGKRQLVCA